MYIVKKFHFKSTWENMGETAKQSIRNYELLGIKGFLSMCINKFQEQVNKLSIGTIPGSMWVVLENDLVDCCKPGDDVIIW